MTEIKAVGTARSLLEELTYMAEEAMERANWSGILKAQRAIRYVCHARRNVGGYPRLCRGKMAAGGRQVTKLKKRNLQYTFLGVTLFLGHTIARYQFGDKPLPGWLTLRLNRRFSWLFSMTFTYPVKERADAE